MTENYQLVESLLQQPLDNGDVVCNLCLWRCRLRHGQRGFCQAHVNRNGTLYNLSYGIISAIEVGRAGEVSEHRRDDGRLHCEDDDVASADDVGVRIRGGDAEALRDPVPLTLGGVRRQQALPGQGKHAQ